VCFGYWNFSLYGSATEIHGDEAVSGTSGEFASFRVRVVSTTFYFDPDTECRGYSDTTGAGIVFNTRL